MGKLPKKTTFYETEISHIILRMCSLVKHPVLELRPTLEIEPEEAFLACGTVLALNCKDSFTLTCYLFLQSGDVDKMDKNPVINQDDCSVKREKNITGVLTLGL